MRVLDRIIQGSDSWWNARRGRITASNMHRVLTARGGESSRSQDPYLTELVQEVAFQGPNFFSANAARNKPPNKAIEDGVRREPEARQYLAFHLEAEIKQVGLIIHENNLLSSSPDGLLVLPTGEMAGAEIKCPQEETQKRYLLDPGSLLQDYKQQIHGSLVVSGLSLWHLFSYCPPHDEVHLTVRPDAYTERLREELIRFIGRYNEALKNALDLDLAQMLSRLHPSDTYSEAA